MSLSPPLVYLFLLLLLVALCDRAGGGVINRCISADSAEAVIAEEDSTKMQTTGPQNGVRWAIVALTRPGKTDVRTRNRALADKIRPYASRHNITVVYFSESSDFPSSAIDNWRQTFDGLADVKLVNTAALGFNLPERYGYKYMCKFFALDMFSLLRDLGFDYYMRCDTDCYIKTLQYDVFDWIEQNKVGYGYSMRKLEAHGPTKQTIPTWTQKYLQKCGGLEPTAVMDKPLSVCFNFYNNWHIGKVSFFNRPDVRHFLESVNESGHIQLNRWGDSTIQAYAVRLFMRPDRIRQIPNFTYVHGSHANRLISTFGDGSMTEVPQRLPNWVYRSAT
jgi:Glycolipid 2-alpha-mannosyltransferase